jgi:3-oxoadipate enol-lactonase
METGVVDLRDGARLHFDVAGDGPVVVFLHPGLWDRRTWDDQMRTFPAAGYRAVRYDARGYGESSRPTGDPYSPVDDQLALLDALDIAEAALVGCSAGGSTEIDFTLEHPDRVWALVPVASGMSGFEGLEEEEDWWEERWAPVQAAIDAGDLERAEDLQLAIWAPLGTEDAAGRRIRQIAFDNIHELTMDESAQVEIDPPASHRLGEIDIPTLVLIAEHDTPDMRRVGDLIARGIPGALKATIEGADHVVNVRQPARFDDAVLAFLDQVRPTA